LPKADQSMLDATHRVLAEAPIGASATTIWHRLREAGYAVPQASSVRRYMDQLERMGILADDGRVVIPPLYPAYLLADLPEPGRAGLQAALTTHSARLRQLADDAHPRKKGAQQLLLFLGADAKVSITDGIPGTVVETRTTIAQLQWLRERCRDLGAQSIQSFLVLRQEVAA
jgi:hypothetical protein